MAWTGSVSIRLMRPNEGLNDPGLKVVFKTAIEKGCAVVTALSLTTGE
jgi:hypothetical protein